MINRIRKLSFGLPLVFLLCAPAGHAQQTSNDDLKKQIEALTDTVKAMQKDLQDIKAMLQSRVPAPPPQKVDLDIANHPAHGEVTAKLTLIEFSDYQ